MPVFKYRAFDKAGKTVEGLMEMQNQDAVIDSLRRRGLFVGNISKQTKSFLAFDLKEFIDNLTPVGTKDKSIFCQQLSTMVGAGLNLTKALEILEGQTQNTKFKKVIGMVRRDVSQGSQLSVALSRFPDIFDKLFIAMVHTGEVGGGMADLLSRWATFAERDDELKGRFKAAMMYPIVVLCISCLAIFALITFVLPNFVEIFETAGVTLPAPTRILNGLSKIIRKQSYILVGGGVAFVVAFKQFKKTRKGHFMMDKFKLKMPVFGQLFYLMVMGRFARVFGILLSSGITVIESLEICKEVTNNVVINRVLDRVMIHVRQGGSISKPMADSGVFSPLVTSIIPVGEETGTIDKLMIKIADFYDRDLDNMIRSISSIIEPILLVVMGGIVGFIAMSLILPMYDIIKVVRRGM
ncbi:MAG: type II secretion system F family protein [bacterium]